MRTYKNMKYLFKGLLWLVTIVIIILIIFPGIKHIIKPISYTAIDMKTHNEISGFNWIVENGKWKNQLDEKIELIVVNDGKKFDKDLMANINNNKFIGEMLFSEFGNDLSKHNFLGSLFNTNFTGYIGKTCKDLSDLEDIPEKIIENYEKLTGKSWSYYGEGIILTDEINVLVLLQGDDYSGKLMLETAEGSFPYVGFFEVLEDSPNMTSSFKISVEDIGKDKLDEVGLSNKFAAEIVVNSRVFDGIYYAGQFSEIPVDVPSSYDSMANIMKNKGLYDDNFNESIYWKWYYPRISKFLEYRKSNQEYFANDKGNINSFYVDGKTIYLKKENEDKPFFIKGVNLGSALPGKSFTEFPTDKNVYKNWLEQMEKMNINTLRLYTLLPPSFYQAFYEFNSLRDNPIYLLQEIWPEEYPKDHNYLGDEYNQTYKQEIRYVIHALHGNINIPMRSYRAYGIYNYDISQYLIGYLVGREMEPEEVMATDEINEGYKFSGRYLYSYKGASPTEAWLAESCDYALRIEDMFYEDSPLVAIVSWPTLDPKSHDSEWSIVTRKENKFNDNTVVDINHIGINNDNVSGFFGAYHIYPNYPDFMNNEISYNEYRDSQGIFRYGGYLKEFMEGHNKYPAVVAEYGISTSQVTAHYSPDGYHHGGLSEIDQGKGIIRMTDAIAREGYSGAVIFEWMDEWAKKTWTTEPYMIPYYKNPFWHNLLDPEQNYGLLAVEAVEPNYISNGDISFGQNASYIYLKIQGSNNVNVDSQPIKLAINTVKETNQIDEFLLTVGEKTSLIVNPGYNWIKGNYNSIDVPYDEYESLIQVTNGENISMYGHITAERSVDLSDFKLGDFSNPTNSVDFDGKVWTVRIPYGLLGISDPSENMILNDLEKKVVILRDQIDVVEIDEINIKFIEDNKSYSFKLNKWEKPTYRTRLKASFSELSEYFRER